MDEKKFYKKYRPLPKLFTCSKCKSILELDKQERYKKIFTCPECNTYYNYNADYHNLDSEKSSKQDSIKFNTQTPDLQIECKVCKHLFNSDFILYEVKFDKLVCQNCLRSYTLEKRLTYSILIGFLFYVTFYYLATWMKEIFYEAYYGFASNAVKLYQFHILGIEFDDFKIACLILSFFMTTIFFIFMKPNFISYKDYINKH